MEFIIKTREHVQVYHAVVGTIIIIIIILGLYGPNGLLPVYNAVPKLKG